MDGDDIIVVAVVDVDVDGVDVDGNVNFGVDVHVPVHVVDVDYIHAVHVFHKSQHFLSHENPLFSTYPFSKVSFFLGYFEL